MAIRLKDLLLVNIRFILLRGMIKMVKFMSVGGLVSFMRLGLPWFIVGQDVLSLLFLLKISRIKMTKMKQ